MSRWRDSADCLEVGVDSMERLCPRVARLCGGCPVKSECLDSALAEEGDDPASHRFGVRGGLEPLKRYKIAVSSGKVKPENRSDCLDCGAGLIPQAEWNALDRAERVQMRADGFARLGSRERCHNCQARLREGWAAA